MTLRSVSCLSVLAVAMAACGRSSRPAEAGASDTTAAARAAPAPSPPAASPQPAPAQVRPASVSLPPNAFRHEKHRGLACQRCHSAVPGHTVHARVECTACHAPVTATGPPPTPAECAGCHHADTQHRACTSCHDTRTIGPLTLHLDWKLSVWSAPRRRDVGFDHAWHRAQRCTTCHTERPTLLPARECGSCHEHHDGKVDCRSCHQSPPAGAHTNAVHAGCTGSGCHQNPPVGVATLSRDECLLCHADRVNHEPGRACATCHMLQPAHGASAGRKAESQ